MESDTIFAFNMENKRVLHAFRVSKRYHFTTIKNYYKLSKKLSQSQSFAVYEPVLLPGLYEQNAKV